MTTFQDVKVGYFVYMMRICDGTNKTSSYNDGEYIVLAKGAANKSFIAMKAAVGYGGHDNPKSFHESEGWDIVQIYSDNEKAREIALGNIAYGTNIPTPKQWIDSVYSGAKDNGERLLRALSFLSTEKKPFNFPIYEIKCSSATDPTVLSKLNELLYCVKRLMKHLGVA